MKKLMLGMTTAIAMVACGEVASENIVGVDSTLMEGNANLTAAMFDEIGSEGLDIQKIVPKGADMYGGAVTLKILTSGLEDDVEYVYVPAEESPDGETEGWYDEFMTTLITKKFAPGEGFILMNNLEDSTRTVSGEVKLGKPTWELGVNANVTGNVTPIDLSIQDISVGTAVDEQGNLTDKNAEIYGGAFTLKLLTNGLEDDVEYVYVPAEESPDGETSGWYDEFMTTLITKKFAPGEGFVLMNNLETGWAQIPAALTK